jgi:hypothetical protein
MTVPFKELGGSPQEEYNLEGFRAQREFLIAWEDRDAFAAEVLGIVAQHGASTWVPYPGKPTAFAFRLRYEPFDPDNPDCKPLTDLTAGLNSYTNSFAKATVEYRTVNPVDREDGPENEAGTHLTYRMSFDVQTAELLPGGWTWEDQPALPAPDGLVIAKAVPGTDHHLTWHQVIFPPWEAIRSLQGKVNATAFLGCPAGTVLFLGAEANKLFRSGLEAGASPFCWQIHYVFRERAAKQGGQDLGWNHFWRPDPPGWAVLVNAAGPLYESADLGLLFQSASGGGE